MEEFQKNINEVIHNSYFTPNGRLLDVNANMSYRYIEKEQYNKYYQVKNMTEFNLLNLTINRCRLYMDILC